MNQQNLTDLELSIMNYLKQNNYTNTLQELKKESKLVQENTENKQDPDLLIKKWGIIYQLQKRILELEQQLQETQAELQKSTWGKRKVIATQGRKMQLEINYSQKINDKVSCVSMHQEEPIIAIGVESNLIKIFDFENKNTIKQLKGHTQQVLSLTWGQRCLYSSSADMSIKVWRNNNDQGQDLFSLIESFVCAKTLIGHENSVSKIHLIKNTEFLASCSWDQTIRLWDTNTFYCSKVISNEHSDWIRDCDSNEEFFCSTGNDQKVNVFSIQSLNSNSSGLEYQYEAHSNVITTIKISQQKLSSLEQYFIVTGSWDKTIIVFDFVNNQQLYSLIGHNGWIRDLILLNDMQIVISVSEDKTAKVWDLENRHLVQTIDNQHERFLVCIDYQMQFNNIVIGSLDQTISLWKLN